MRTFIWPFLPQPKQINGKDNFCPIHVSLIPHLLTCRLAQPLLDNTKMKLSQFCHVEAANILNIHYVPNIWHIPLLLRHCHTSRFRSLDQESRNNEVL
ncbi:CTP synthase isoform X4 [Gossypium hirsutum]|uniref:CTP synthase isoform X4 n=1 Tax=Gossypium hirsutum TaxID=3635 RepID=A0A1U8NNY7_GOSHI|nr:CTP synthase isoform X4 [Gossypium hirsutum]